MVANFSIQIKLSDLFDNCVVLKLTVVYTSEAGISLILLPWIRLILEHEIYMQKLAIEPILRASSYIFKEKNIEREDIWSNKLNSRRLL